MIFPVESVVDSRRQFINLEARFTEGFGARTITIDVLFCIFLEEWKIIIKFSFPWSPISAP